MLTILSRRQFLISRGQMEQFIIKPAKPARQLTSKTPTYIAEDDEEQSCAVCWFCCRNFNSAASINSNTGDKVSDRIYFPIYVNMCCNSYKLLHNYEYKKQYRHDILYNITVATNFLAKIRYFSAVSGSKFWDQFLLDVLKRWWLNC